VVAAPARRQQVAYAMKRGLSQRAACQLFSVARSTLGYQSRLTTKDAPALAAMRRLSRLYPRFGYRRIAILLRRDGHPMSFDRAWRLWRSAELQVPKKRKRRRAAVSRPRPLPPEQRHHVWAYDFVFDRCANGQVLKCLTIVDEYTRECLAITVSGRIRSAHVIDQLSRLVSLHGAPRHIRSDNGTEFVSRAVLKWLTQNGINTALSDPGKPWQNGLDESFNGKFRDECLNMEWFRSRAEARVVIETWRKQYNQIRPHSSLNYLTPNEYIKTLPETASQQAIL
jgi:putative transposase